METVLIAAPQEIALDDLDSVSGGDGATQPACECHSARDGSLVCSDANGRKCG